MKNLLIILMGVFAIVPLYAQETDAPNPYCQAISELNQRWFESFDYDAGMSCAPSERCWGDIQHVSKLAQFFPNDVVLNMAYNALVSRLGRERRLSHIAEQKQRLENEPDNPIAHLLYALSGSNDLPASEQAEHLNRALELDGRFLWSYLGLANITYHRNRSAQGVLYQHIDSPLDAFNKFRELCPNNTADILWFATYLADEDLKTIWGPDEVIALRTRLELKANDFYYQALRSLWNIEKKRLPEDQAQKNRKKDIAKLKRKLKRPDRYSWWYTLYKAYQMFEDIENAEQIQASMAIKFPCQKNSIIYQTGQWFIDEQVEQNRRTMSVENLQRFLNYADSLCSTNPYLASIKKHYLSTLLEKDPQAVSEEKTVEYIDAFKELNPLYTLGVLIDPLMKHGLLPDIAAQLIERELALRVSSDAWYENNFYPDVPEENIQERKQNNNFIHWKLKAYAAELKGHIDAAAYYWSASLFTISPTKEEMQAKAYALWNEPRENVSVFPPLKNGWIESGGSQKAWDVMYKSQLEKIDFYGSVTKWQVWNSGAMPNWTLEGRNTGNDKINTLAMFEGKVLYLTGWAKWCGNCSAEWPILVKGIEHDGVEVSSLWSRIKEEEGIEFITLNTDFEVEAIPDYISDRKLSEFPILYAYDYWKQQNFPEGYPISVIGVVETNEGELVLNVLWIHIGRADDKSAPTWIEETMQLLREVRDAQYLVL